jgi:phage shock protein PspC (stress-responsive transcriptional regulator)
MMANMSETNGGNGASGPGGPGGSGAGNQGNGPRDWGNSGGWSGSGGPGWGSGKRLERKLSGRWVAGVCAGLAEYFGVDPNLVRVGFAVASLFAGIGPIAYLLGWALIPEEGEKASIAERLINKTGT